MILVWVNHTDCEQRVFVGDRANPYTTIGPGRERELEVPWPRFKVEVFDERAFITEAPETKRKAQ